LPAMRSLYWHRGHEYTLSHIGTTQLKNPLSIDVHLAWSSSLCFIECLLPRDAL